MKYESSVLLTTKIPGITTRIMDDVIPNITSTKPPDVTISPANTTDTSVQTTEYDVKGYRQPHLQEAQVMHDLMQNYNPFVRPSALYSDTVDVVLTLSLAQILDMDEVNQLLTTSVWMTQKWKDASLVWDPADYEGVDEVRIPTSMIWIPDIVLFNNAADSFEGGVMKTNAIIRNDGSVVWNAPAIFKSACKLDPLYFPFDIQNCTLRFGSWTYDGNQLNLTTEGDQADMDQYSSGGEWELLSMPVRGHVAYYACCDAPFPDVRFHIILQRMSLFYMFNLVTPCLIISSLVLMGFYLPADAGEKITLCITLLLALTVFLLLVAETMPPTSEVVPLIGQYFASTIVLVGFSTTLTVVILAIHHRGDSTKVPSWLRWLMLEKLGPMLCIRSPLIGHSTDEKESREVNGGNSVAHAQGGVVNPVYEGDDPEGKFELSAAVDDGTIVLGEKFSIPEKHENTLIERYIEQIAKNIEFVADRERDKGAGDEIAIEWKEVAKIFDRFLMLVFTLLTTLLTLIFFLMAANHKSI
ncbi:neuronal acetylcholine receptor subunit alpha-10-like [Glandiceps talaboti]